MQKSLCQDCFLGQKTWKRTFLNQLAVMKVLKSRWNWPLSSSQLDSCKKKMANMKYWPPRQAGSFMFALNKFVALILIRLGRIDIPFWVLFMSF